MNDLLPSYFYKSHIRFDIYSIGKIGSHNYLQGFVRRSIYFLTVMIQVGFPSIYNCTNKSFHTYSFLGTKITYKSFCQPQL